MTIAYINRIGTAVPDHDVHDTFIRFADQMLPERSSRLLFKRMVQRAEIEHRFRPARRTGLLARSFRLEDWQRLLAAAGQDPAAVEIRWHVPFRLCVSRIR